MTLLILSVLAAVAVLAVAHGLQRLAVSRRVLKTPLVDGMTVRDLLSFHRRTFGQAVMEIVFDAPVTPDDVTMFVRAVPQSDAFILDRWLPNRYFDDNEVDFDTLVRTNRTARFRSFDGRLHVSSRDSGSRNKVKLPPLSSSLSRGEYERLQLEFARTGGTNSSALAQAIYNDAEQLTREVLNRMELARGDALSDFVVSLGLADEPGSALEADYGAPAGHTVAPATTWTTANLATMTPLTDLVAWSDVYVAAGNSGGAGALLMSNTRARILQRSAEIINAVHGSAAAKTRVTRAELNELLGSEGLPEIVTYDASVDVDGATTRIVADDKVLFLPESGDQLGYTAWGVTATALELVSADASDMSFEDARGIVGVVDKVGPPYREFTFVDAVGLPVIANPRALLVADVA